MFESFSKTFESTFRVIFICWVCVWGFFDISKLLFSYASFAGSNPTSNVLGFWWVTTLGQVITLAVGIFLLFLMANIPGRIAKLKKVTGVPLMTTLAVVYYLFVTIAQIFATAIFKSSEFTQEFIFLSAWLFPSIIIMVVHILYFVNIGKYNQTLESNNSVQA
jgi:hypothetical protein